MASNDSFSEKVKDLHNEMVDKISEMIVYESDCWVRLLGKFNNNPLTPQDKKSIKSIQDLFEILMEKTTISYGNYEKLIDKLNKVHPSAATVVKNWNAKMNKQIKLDKEMSRKRKLSENEDKEDGQRSQDAPKDHKGRKRTKRETSGSSRPVRREEKRKLHADMVNELDEQLSSNMVTRWSRFKNNMKYKLGFGEAVVADITDMYSACDKMRARGKIDIGRYDQLKEVVEDIDEELVDIINEYLEKMGIDPTRELRRTRSYESS